MDGLVPKSSVIPNHVMKGLSRSGSFTRSGSRKYQRHPECIPERVEAEQAPKSPQPLQAPQPLHPDSLKSGAKNSDPPSSNITPPVAPPNTLNLPASDGSPSDAPISPLPSPNMAPRRQKISAKAKKRQKAQEEGGEGS